MVKRSSACGLPLGKAPSIILTGIMGTGKTETARVLAELLGLEFVDTDSMVEAAAGMSISEIFNTRAERSFRDLEAAVCEDIRGRRGAVVATGGGAILSERNFQALSQSGTLILLEASPQAIRKRLQGTRSRPLLLSGDGSKLSDSEIEERISDLLRERESFYRRVSFKIDTTDLTPREVAYKISVGLETPSEVFLIGERSQASGGGSGTSIVHRSSPPMGTTIEVGKGVLSKIGPRLRAFGLDTTVFLIMPRIVRDLFLPQIEASLDAASLSWRLGVIDDGDARKDLRQAGAIIDWLAENEAERDAAVVTVGGGVTGDMGGFAAAIYMRGVPLVQVPTTLLAQADSSIGGKVGVNHPRAKNLVGSFHLPCLVLSDPCSLRTLPMVEISNGMAEVIKTALLGSRDLFDFIEAEVSGDPEGKLHDTEFLQACVVECVSVKGSIIERDLFEKGPRQVLNLGHTVAHALESSSRYKGLRHGQAVSLGLVAALRIAVRRGLAERDLLDRTKAVLEHCKLPTEFSPLERDAVASGLRLDKKRRRGRLHFVLPVLAGKVEVVDDVSESEIFATISEGEP